MQVQCEINNLMEKETSTPSSLSSMASLYPFNPFCSPLLVPTSAWSFSSALLCSDLRFPKIASYLLRFRNCVGCASDAKLQSHRWILAPGLTKHMRAEERSGGVTRVVERDEFLRARAIPAFFFPFYFSPYLSVFRFPICTRPAQQLPVCLFSTHLSPWLTSLWDSTT